MPKFESSYSSCWENKLNETFSLGRENAIFDIIKARLQKDLKMGTSVLINISISEMSKLASSYSSCRENKVNEVRMHLW